jgi:hypothetical protein
MSAKNSPPLYTATGNTTRAIHTDELPKNEITTCNTDDTTGVTTCTTVPVYKKPVIGKSSSVKSVPKEVIIQSPKASSVRSVRPAIQETDIIIEPRRATRATSPKRVSPTERKVVIEIDEPEVKRSSTRTTSPKRTSTLPVRASPGKPGTRVQTAPVIIDEEEFEEEVVEIETSESEEEVEVDINIKKGASIKNLKTNIDDLKNEVDLIQQSDKYNQITDIETVEEKTIIPAESVTIIQSQTKEIRQNGIVNIMNNLIVQQGYGLRVFSTETRMLEEQDKKYGIDLDSMTEFKGSKLSYGLYSPVTNFLYPKSTNDPSLPPDAPTSLGGWLDKNSVTGQLGVYSPKLNYMINLIRQRPGRRHVIYTHYLERYGADLIVALLRTLGFQPLQLTYDFRDPAGRSRGRKTRQHLVAVQKFNTDVNFSIIVSNMNILDAGLLDVDYLHFFDTPSFNVFSSYINKIYHMQYYRVRKPLTVIFHLSTRLDNTKTLDGEYFEKLYIDMVEKVNIGTKLV